MPATQTAPPAKLSTVDVRLGHDGQVAGQVMLASGQTAADATVVLIAGRLPVAVVHTDQEGQFSLPGANGDASYLIYWQTSNQQSGLLGLRVWPSGTAPVHALEKIVLHSQENLVRGQYSVGGIGCFLTNPWVMAGLITAAIGVPIGLTDEDTAS